VLAKVDLIFMYDRFENKTLFFAINVLFIFSTLYPIVFSLFFILKTITICRVLLLMHSLLCFAYD